MKLLKIAKKFVTNFLMGLKIWDEVGVGGPLFSKLQQVGEFSYFWSKSMISELRGRVPVDVCHQEPSFSLRGPAKAPTPTSAEGASLQNSLDPIARRTANRAFVLKNWKKNGKEKSGGKKNIGEKRKSKKSQCAPDKNSVTPSIKNKKKKNNR